MTQFNWYNNLVLPPWAPPSYIFGPVWTILYSLIFITFGKVFMDIVQGKIPLIYLIPLGLNLVLNFSFSYVQFTLRNFLLASIIIFLMIVTLIWSMVGIFKYDKFFIIFNIPYLLWICFAFVLQSTITFLNWK